MTEKKPFFLFINFKPNSMEPEANTDLESASWVIEIFSLDPYESKVCSPTVFPPRIELIPISLVSLFEFEDFDLYLTMELNFFFFSFAILSAINKAVPLGESTYNL